MKIGDKIIWFTDIHFGLRNNERRHNEECVSFIKWAIKEAKEFGADTSIFGGDWHHSRSAIQTSTLNYSNTAFSLLNKSFKTHYHIIGNHDLYFKDKRDIHSTIFAENYENIKIINEITKIGDAILCPWLVGNEHKQVAKSNVPYIFGHFELPFFLMNALVAMPDVGHLKADDFKNPNQHLFSGHFHKRQTQTNIHGATITYTGNCFPHDFSDAGDDSRGIMLLELGKEPIYKRWADAPKYRNINLSELIDDPAKHVDNKTIVKATIDLDISFEEANFIKETMMQEYGVREFKLIPSKNQLNQLINTDGMIFETIDEIVTTCINGIDSTTLDKNLILDIYNNI